MNFRLGCVFFVSLTGVAAAGQPSAADLNTCAAIATQAERLACYDKLAGRGASSGAATPQGVQPSAAPATAVTPKPARPPSSPAAPATVPDPGPTSQKGPAPGTPEAFGLYAAEHPKAPVTNVDSISGKVVDLEYDNYGRETVSLEGGPMWQLAGSDALLAKGDSVTIRRAALGSYFLTTPAGREHRVKRVR